MSVSGNCEICARGETEWGCDRCGRLVCSDHYDRETGLCSECAAEVRRPEPQTDDTDAWRDGVDIHR